MGNYTTEECFTAQYNFDQLLMALNERIQLEREIEKAETSSSIYYG